MTCCLVGPKEPDPNDPTSTFVWRVHTRVRTGHLQWVAWAARSYAVLLVPIGAVVVLSWVAQWSTGAASIAAAFVAFGATTLFLSASWNYVMTSDPTGGATAARHLVWAALGGLAALGYGLMALQNQASLGFRGDTPFEPSVWAWFWIDNVLKVVLIDTLEVFGIRVGAMSAETSTAKWVVVIARTLLGIGIAGTIGSIFEAPEHEEVVEGNERDVRLRISQMRDGYDRMLDLVGTIHFAEGKELSADETLRLVEAEVASDHVAHHQKPDPDKTYAVVIRHMYLRSRWRIIALGVAMAIAGLALVSGVLILGRVGDVVLSFVSIPFEFVSGIQRPFVRLLDWVFLAFASVIMVAAALGALGSLRRWLIRGDPTEFREIVMPFGFATLPILCSLGIRGSVLSGQFDGGTNAALADWFLYLVDNIGAVWLLDIPDVFGLGVGSLHPATWVGRALTVAFRLIIAGMSIDLVANALALRSYEERSYMTPAALAEKLRSYGKFRRWTRVQLRGWIEPRP